VHKHLKLLALILALKDQAFQVPGIPRGSTGPAMRRSRSENPEHRLYGQNIQMR